MKEEFFAKKLICKVWHCDWGHHYHFLASDIFVRDLTKALSEIGIELILEEESIVPYCDREIEKMKNILRSIHEVQGLEYIEGVSCVDALESLVSKYAELK